MATHTVEEQISFADLRDQLDAVIERTRETKRPIAIARDGEAAAVIIDASNIYEIRKR